MKLYFSLLFVIVLNITQLIHASKSKGASQKKSKKPALNKWKVDGNDKGLSEAILNKKVTANDFNVIHSDDEQDETVILISSKKSDSLGLGPNALVTLKGKKRRETIAKVAVSDSVVGDDVKMSLTIRNNLSLRVGDVAIISKAPQNVKAAKSLSVAVYNDNTKVMNEDLYENFVKPFFLDANRAIRIEDSFRVSGLGTSIEMKITQLEVEGELTAVYGIINKETDVILEDTFLDRKDEKRQNELGYDDIGGCRKQLALIRELVELPIRHPEVFTTVGVPPPRGVLLYGPSGTGKTSLARAVAAETGAYFFVLNGPEMMSKRSGESEENLRKAFEDAEKNAPSIIFIDEIDSIAPKRDKAGGEVEKRVVSQLLTLFDGIKKQSQVVIIGATNRPNIIDPALRRFGRFDRELILAQPDEEGRLEILKIKTRDMKLGKDVDLKKIGMDIHGYVGADIAQLCMEAAFSAIREIFHLIDLDSDSIDPEILNSIQINQKHFDHAIQVTHPSSLRENLVEVPDVKWEDIGGLEDVKQELRELVQLPVQYGHLYEKFGQKASKGVLFYGPPGCGKTLLAKAIANEAGANFMSVKGPELLNAHIGESEANVRNLFNKARAASPCILFFDELDSIAKARGNSQGSSGLGDNVINQILTEIDGIGSESRGVFIIGATNRPDMLDPSIMRPGHLDQLVYIPLPDYLSRVSIFKANLRKCPVDPLVDVEKLAKATEGFSGADITEICQRAAKNAIREDIGVDVQRAQDEQAAEESGGVPSPEDFKNVNFIRKDHFEEAMSRARRSVSDKDIEQYKKFIQKQKADADAAGAGNFKFSNKKESETTTSAGASADAPPTEPKGEGAEAQDLHS